MIVLVLAAALAVQTPRVQSYLAAKAVSALESKVDARIEFSRIIIKPFNTLLIKDLVLIDPAPYTEDEFERGWDPVDTLFRARTVSATFNLGGLFFNQGLHLGHGLHLRRVSVEDGLFHLVNEPPRDGYKSNIQRMFHLHSKTGPKEPGGYVFDIKKVRIKNVRYRMNSFKEDKHPYSGYGLDYEDLDVTVSARGHDMQFYGSRMHAAVDALTAYEKSGYRIINLTGHCAVGLGKTHVHNIHLVDPYSDFRAKYFSMSYRNTKSFKNFLSEVKLGAELRKGTLGIQTISALSGGVLHDSEAVLDIAGGRMDGYVNDFKVSNLQVREVGSGVKTTIDASCVGLPDYRSMGVKFDVKDMVATTAGLTTLIKDLAPSSNVDLSKFASGETIHLNANGSGTLDKMLANATLYGVGGTASVAADIRNLISPDRDIEITGTARTEDVDAGRIAGIDKIGAVTARTGLRATIGKNGMSVNVDSLRVDKLTALGYAYTGLAAAGRYDGKHFDGKIVCSDPNLKFLFQGIFNLSKKSSNAVYKFYANLAYADLKALNIDNRGDRSKASCEIEANFRQLTRKDLLGDIKVSKLYLENDEGGHNIGDISIGSHSIGDLNRIQFKSSFADGGFVGGKAISSLFEDIQNVTTRKHLPSIYSKDARTIKDAADYKLSFDFHDCRDLLSFVLPGAYVADSTSLDLSIDRKGILRGKLNSGRLAIGKNYLKNISADIDNLDGSLNCIMTSDELSLSGLGFRNAALTAYGENDNFSLGFHYDGLAGTENVGEIYLNGDLSRDATDTLVVRATPLQSYIRMAQDTWEIGNSTIVYRAGDVSVDGFSLTAGDQLLALDGGFSTHHPDTLRMNLDRFGLDLVNHFTSKDLGLAGKISGKAMLTSPVKTNLGMLIGLGCDSLAVGGVNAGSLKLASSWDDETESFKLFLKEVVEDRNALSARGTYTPKDRRIDLSADADELMAALAAPFLSSIFSDISGGLSGSVQVSGPLDTLSLSSSGLRFDNTKLQVAMTGVPYIVNGPFHVDDNGLWLDGVSVTDGENGRGDLVGALRFDHLKDAALDLSVRMRNMKVLAMDEAGNKGVYGDLAIGGRATVTGPFNAIAVDADIMTQGTGHVNVPLGGGASASAGSDLLTFREREVWMDPYELMMQKFNSRKKSTGDFSAHAKVGITPEVVAAVDIESGMGNRIKASGSGSVILDLRPSKDIFQLDGDYNISSGSYHFEVPGIVQRDLTISNGSSIKFGGDVMDTDLDINAVYTLKTSLSRLLTDTTSVSTRRTVDCGISITDKISNPRLGFSITIPDLDPTTKAQVESALNTEDKVQKQFVSLLLLGSFLPDESSGIINGSQMIYKNVGDLMSNQLNNILQKLEIPVDLGFGYQANDGGTDIFDVAISTQLFNNRVVVNGSVGNRKYSTSTSQNGDMVGDLDIEVKLDKPGQFRLNLFSHSADEYTSYLDYSQRNGVGIAYQKEYNKLSDLFRRKNGRRSEREERGERPQRSEGGERRERRRARGQEMNVITIGKEDNGK